MWRLFQILLDTILPKKERVVRIESYTIEDLQISPAEHEACGVQITTLMTYRSRAVEDLVRALKYDGAGSAAELLAGALAEYLREEIATMKMFSTKPVLIVPVPLHPARLLERGFNQVERVLEKLPWEFRDGSLSKIERGLLLRRRATVAQTRLSRPERLKNVAGAFALSNPLPVQNAHIFLIDDVTTTGATLAEAARPFGKAPLSLLALAHA